MSATAPGAVGFSIVPFSEENLYNALSNPRHCPPTIVRNKRQAKYLAGYLTQIGVATILIESEYVDRDYLEDYAAYYARCFKPYDRFCKRLHFFSKSLDENILNRLIRDEAPEEEGKQVHLAYAGFVVVRPLPDAVIGRTVLRQYDPDKGRRNYTCLVPYKANVFGISFELMSLAFQEQDTVLAACATVALWCCFHRTKQMFGSMAASPAEITRTANQILHEARPIPSRGLIVQQICNAVRRAGLEPEIVQIRANVPLLSLIYSHLALGMPVILGGFVGGSGHAITLVGFSLRDTPQIAAEVASTSKSIPSKGLRIDEFYAHDDQVGPFSRLKVAPNQTFTGPGGPIDFPVAFQSSVVDSSGKPLTFFPAVIIVPVYNKIRVRFLDVQIVLTALHDVLFPTADLRAEWDVTLTTTNEYKRFIRTEGILENDAIAALRLKQHPRFIWRAILRHAGRPLMELLFDATDMERSFPIYAAVWSSPPYKTFVQAYLNTSDPALKDLFLQALGEKLWSFLVRESA
jgi:hypothetical protein